MKAVILTTDKFGHVNPAIHLAGKLIKEGWEVILPNDLKFENVIADIGAKFIDHSLFDFYYETAHDMKPFEGTKRNTAAILKILPKLLEYLEDEKPDLVISDRVFAWGRLAADKLDIPVITFSATPFMNADLIIKYGLLWDSLQLESIRNLRAIIPAIRNFEKLGRMLKISVADLADILSNNETAVNVVFTSKEIHPVSERYNSSYKFLGPAINPGDFDEDPGFEVPEDAAYISLGTIYNDDLEFFRTVRDYYVENGRNVIISVQDKIAKKLKFEDYPNIIHGSYLPQKAILPRVKYFITHGGFNSLNESIYAKTPMISIPQMMEQKLNALRTEEIDCGLACMKVGDLIEKIEELESNYDRFKVGVTKAAKSYDDVDDWGEVYKEIVAVTKKE